VRIDIITDESPPRRDSCVAAHARFAGVRRDAASERACRGKFSPGSVSEVFPSHWNVLSTLSQDWPGASAGRTSGTVS
jgi:hypothetical protein